MREPWGRRRVLPCQQQRGRGGGRDCRSSSARMSASVHDEAWDLTLADRPLVEAKRWANRLRFAVMLLFFRARGRFPRVAAEVNGTAVAKLARSLGVPEPGSGEPLLPDAADHTAERQRAEIRALLGFREAGIADAEALGAWLRDHGVARTRDPIELAAEAEARCRTLCIEPPASDRIARIVRTAARAYEDGRTAVIHARLTPAMRISLDALLQPAGSEGTGDAEDGAVPDGRADAPLVHLRAGPGRASVASLRDALARLGTIRRISLPADLFTDWSLRELEACRQRVAVEAPHELRRHPEATRHVWLAAYAHLRGRAVTDPLVDLLIETVHHIGARAEHKVEQELLDDLKRVGGKQSLLFDLAGAAVEKPDGTVREVLFPVVGEQTLRDLVRESKATGPTYRTTLRATIRSSYRGHYRRAGLDLLAVLDFRSNNDVHRPVIRALDLIRRYAETRVRAYPVEEDVPLDGIVRPLWRDAVVDQDPQGRPRIDRITYEICALEALRDQLRCKEVWVAGANRYRNPDEDLPADFDAQRAGHYQALDLPLDASAFIDGLREEVHAALAQLDQGLPRNPDVRITSKRGGWISLTPLLPRPSPANIEALKAEVADTWPLTSLLDIVKEADLRLGFTDRLRSSTAYEALDRAVLRPRLLLCLNGLGTNAGKPDAYPNLQPVLSRPIDWELIGRQYDEMVKYATALRLGTAEAEAILRRFTRENVQHPTYKALAELGKAVKTTFLCRSLHDQALRREINDGLNVVEHWNSANDFIFFARRGEFSSNRREDQELSMLSLHLLQNCMVYVNTLMVQQVLTRPEWKGRLTPRDLHALTPLFWGHVNPYGRFDLDM